MKKLLKIAIGLAVVFVLVVVLGVVILIASINSVAKAAVEKGGTYAMGVPTTLDSASVGLFSGQMGLKNLSIANPPGFKGKRFFGLGQGDVAINLQSLNTTVIEVPSLVLSDIDVSLEKQSGSANYQVIMDNLSKIGGSSGGSGGPSTPSSSSGDDKKLVIKDLVIKNVKVHAELVGGGNAVTDVVNKASSVDVTIPEIKLQNVGKTGEGVANTGVTMSQLSGIIMQAVLSAAAEKGSGIIPSDLLGDLKGNLGKLGNLTKLIDAKAIGDVAGNAVQGLGKGVQGAAEQGKKAVEDLGKGLGGLIPGAKKDDKDKK